LASAKVIGIRTFAFLYAAVRIPITLKLGNKTQIPAANFVILPSDVKSNQNLKMLTPLKLYLRLYFFLFKCLVLPEVVANYAL
jgi:hypothetical protein